MERKMNGRGKAIVLQFITLLAVTFQAHATITDVNILPTIPALTDPITIIVSGVEGSPAQITNTDFWVNDNSLSLDIYLDIGIIPVVTPWTHSEYIGTLPAGVYDLSVQTFVPMLPSLNDDYFRSFEVVPEPSTLTILGFALMISRVFTKRKK